MKRIVLVICMLSMGSLARAQTPSLGTAANFAVLGGTAVTCTSSVITGDVGVSPGSAVTNTGCTISGTVHANDSAAMTASTDFLSAYNAIGLMPCTQTILTTAFTGNVPALGPLAPGVYCFPAAVAFTNTTLTLDGSTNPNGIWVFKVGAALTGTGFQVVMSNGAQPCNVFWAVGAGATLTTSTPPPLFQGNLLAGNTTGGSITITGGSLVGRALASVAVTMTTTNVNGVCALVDQAVAQAKASCKNDDDDRDEDKDKDKDKDRDRDRDKDKGHHRHHDKDKDKDKDKDHN